MRQIAVLSALISLILFIPVLTFSQNASSGTVLGTITDPSGAAIPGAAITLTSSETNAVRTQTSDAIGGYSFPNVAPGLYSLKVIAGGFKTFTIPSVEVQVARSSAANVQLEIGSSSDTVSVEAEAGSELQTTNAQIGNVISQDNIQRLPTLQHDASELITLQPGVAVSGVLARVGGNTDDQNVITIDGADVTDTSGIASQTSLRTVVPIPADSVEEYRVGVSSTDASYGRAPGANVALVGRHGSNQWHGAAYWYTQNSVLNANTWDDNHLGIARPSSHDNRGGGRFGGPIQKDKTFFFINWEARRFPQVVDFTSTVPTDSLRQGILKFRDAAGNIVAYNLATANNCGTAGNSSCDPRGIGISPTVHALYSLYPAGNNSSVGDGLNITGFSSAVRNPLATNYYLIRLDHNLTANWKANVNYNYFNVAQTSGATSIVGGVPAALQQNPQLGILASGILTGILSRNLVNVSRFSWLHDYFGPTGISPIGLAQSLNIPGTNSPSGFVNLTTPSALTNPAPIPSHDLENDHYLQWSDDLTWTWNRHTANFGVDIRHIRAQQAQRDITTGLRALLGTGSNLTITSANTPPTCSAAVTTNCLPSSQVSTWGALYAGTLGMVDNNSSGVVFNNDFTPAPFGTYFTANESHMAYQFYGQDTWRLNRVLTLNYGLTYGWQEPPTEANGRFAIMTDLATGQRLPAAQYIANRMQAAENGQFYAPILGWMPINKLGGPAYNTDRSDIAPRVGIAWNPSYSHGLAAKILGKGSNVIRGGFGIYYGRINEINNVILDTLGVGYSRVFQVTGPKCNVSGTPGPGCNAAGANAGLSWYRVGVDGNVPAPAVPQPTLPIVPANPLGQATSYLIDQDVKNAKNYILSFSVQHQFSFGTVLEAGFNGNYGRRLAQNVNFSAVPYFMKDPNSNQTMAQAFDAVATQLRTGTSPATVTPQPFFEHILTGTPLGSNGATYTQNLAASQSTNFINGNLGTLIYNGVDLPRLNAGLPVIDNLQVENNYVRTDTGQSNYNAAFLSLRKRLSHGLTFDFSYTFSRALDDAVFNQDTAALSPNTYYPHSAYGPSAFDRTHVVNGSFVYDLPFGKSAFVSSHRWLNNMTSGWYMSGIFTKYSGLPLLVTEGTQVWGEDASGGTAIAAIPNGHVPSTGLSSGISGSGGVGTTGNPGVGTGLNLFSNPASAFASFRQVLISQDGRDGHANPMRGLPFWNLDTAFGKSTPLTEQVKLSYVFQFFNIFNTVNYATPSLSLTSPASFGVVTNQFVPNNRQAGSRWIQFSMRLEF